MAPLFISTMKKKLSKEQLAKIEGAAYRKALIELGMYSRPTHKVHSSKKKYNRKLNQNKKWKED